MRLHQPFSAALLAVILGATHAAAEDSDAELATKLSNPVADLISVPLQFNYDCCTGPEDGAHVTLNIQPVIPFELSDHWNLLVRTILPVIDQQQTLPGQGDHFGLGDTLQSFFFSPVSKPGELIWAVGPVFFWPTGTDDTLGSHKWGAGPTALVAMQQHGWTYGMLANHVWSYGGEPSRPNINRTFLQPFLSYQWPDTTTLGVNSESTYDWEHEQWSVPINVTLGRLYRFGKTPVNFALSGRYYALTPQDGPRWGARFVVTLLFPA